MHFLNFLGQQNLTSPLWLMVSLLKVVSRTQSVASKINLTSQCRDLAIFCGLSDAGDGAMRLDGLEITLT